MAFRFRRLRKQILGHEFAGKVEAVGKGATMFKKGKCCHNCGLIKIYEQIPFQGRNSLQVGLSGSNISSS